MKRYTIYITDAEYDALHRLSDETELATAELVRRALDQYLTAPQVTKGEKLPDGRETVSTIKD